MNFKITEITKQRSIFGVTVYKAVSDDGVILTLNYNNATNVNKNMLHDDLIALYLQEIRRQTSSNENYLESINIGDIV